MVEKISSESNESSETPWDSLAADLAKTRQEIKEAAPERATRHFKEIREIEVDFARRNASLKADDELMSRKEFEKWEDAVADEVKWGDDEMRRGEMRFGSKAEAMQHMVAYSVDTELHKTIEAQAGNYYYERDAELHAAIKESKSDTAKSDLAFLNGFYPAVAAHLDYKYMTREDVRDYGSDDYERQRTRAHNDAIRYLNGLNGLAYKYGTRPFTARSFWTSDLCDKSAQTPAIARVMRYDRDIVEEYYAIAFSAEVQKREARLARAIERGF